MALPLPNLDDRRWADLVDEARASVPRHAPQWTDHNAHDPGITLIELLAWIAEQGLFRLNQVPERHRLKFLRLIGYDPRPPRPARTVITLAPASNAPPLPVPAGALFEGGPDALPFRTVRAMLMQAARLRAVLIDDGGGLLRDGTPDLDQDGRLSAFGPEPGPGAALYLGFEGATAGLPLSLAVQVAAERSGAGERTRLQEELDARRAACATAPGWPCPGPVVATPVDVHRVPLHHSVHLVWEALSATTPEAWTPLQAVTATEPPQPGEVRDDTRAFTLDGLLELNLPPGAVAGSLGPEATPLHYVRARLASGAWDAPPVLGLLALNGTWAEQRRPLWRELVVAPSVPPPAPAPTIGGRAHLRLALDEAGVVTALTVEPPTTAGPAFHVFDYTPPAPGLPGRLVIDADVVARGHGFPDQEVALPAAPVVAPSVRAYTHDGLAWQRWETRPDLDASRRTDFHLALDPVAGRLRGGDGERGRVLPAGQLLIARAGVTAAGGGNVRAGTITRVVAGALNTAWLSPPGALDGIVGQPRPAAGGTDGERVPDAARRAVEALLAHERLVALGDEQRSVTLDQLDPVEVRAVRAPQRALTLLDYERLALDVPGTQVARARAWAGHHPSWPCPGMAGLVTVVIVPDDPVARPEPSAGLLSAVHAYLDRRRTIGTRVEVVGPRYLVVSVSARVRRRRLADPARVRADARAALRAFLDARTGGPSGRGWPFGRDVYRSEVLQVLDEVEGVDYVEELSLRAGTDVPQCGNLAVCPTWLVAPGLLQVEAR